MSNRTSFLDRLLGKSNAEDLRADLQKAATLLDQAGLERKEITSQDATATDTTEVAPAQSPETDPVKEAAAKLAQQIFDGLGGDLTQLTVEKLAAVIAAALQPAVEDPQEEMPMQTPPEQDPAAKAAGDMVKCPACGEMTPADKGVCEKCGAPLSGSKALGDLITQMISDQGQIAKSYGEMKNDIAAVKALAPVIEKLVNEVEAIRSQLDQRPRSASAADETALDPNNDAIKALKESIEKGVDGGGEQNFLGVPVRQMPK